MSQTETIQIHDSDSTCDTVDASSVPIVFVPGVLGSRVTMAMASRTWDADTTSEMLAWIPLSDDGRHANRNAFSPRAASARTLKTLGSVAVNAVSSNEALS